MEILAMLPCLSIEDVVSNIHFKFLHIFRQLIMLVDVYQGAEVSEFICPIALSLGADRVAEVRLISYKLVSIVVTRCSQSKFIQGTGLLL